MKRKKKKGLIASKHQKKGLSLGRQTCRLNKSRRYGQTMMRIDQ